MATGTHTGNQPLVSVIIPCYNHGQYLHKAIESVLRQTYKYTEIVVVDDGSTDNTKPVSEQYEGVKYIYQQNQGLSAARNTGIRHSTGDFILFLDADDWLYPKGIEVNTCYLARHEELAFVSGTFDAFYINENTIKEGALEVHADHYCRLLQGNYIGMISTVLFRRWVFDEFLYDTRLRNCEDYDLYLNIARKYPVFHHQNKIAVYRIHSANMSNNVPMMLNGVLGTLDRQRNKLTTEKERKAFKTGQKIWKKYYCHELYENLSQNKTAPSKANLLTLLKYRPPLLMRYILKSRKSMIKANVKKLMPATSLRLLHRMGIVKSYIPAPGKAKPSDLYKTTPLSTDFGYDRGGPIDRYYIEQFLGKEAASIQGRVLEIGDNEYTLQFGGTKVMQSDILHVNESNPMATLIGDLSNAPQIPDDLFDCIILTQTLQMIYDFKGALGTCYRILKPGGTLLLTVPGITPIDHGEWKETWYWSFTDKAMRKLFEETFDAGATDIRTYGNVFAASAFLYGVGLPEVPQKKLDIQDPHYQVIVAVKAVKR
ncbi:glycosyltransferase [Pontibacter ruber]|uniref:Glycosyltransferase n=1 Tax=Pontibacter ruber TaxID=1343895 RepID=A0ABW5CZY5_9BACT|nr:glycosyltransferase [Pontibacter ruber]